MGQSKRYFQIGLIVFAFIYMLSLANAVDTYEQSTDILIKKSVRIDGNLPANTNCNITIYSPDKTTLIDFEAMTNSGNYYNYTLNSSFTQTKGLYNYDITCTNGTLSDTKSYEFIINYGGVEPTEARTQGATRIIYLFYALAFVCIILIFIVKTTPVKLTFGIVAVWFILIGINTTFIALQDEIVNPKLESFFSFFLVLANYVNQAMITLLFILWLITFISTIFENKRKRKLIKYG